MTDDRSLEAEARSIPGPSTRDTNLDAAGALASLVPYAGGFLTELGHRIPREREERRQAFLERVGRKLDASSDRLDQEFIQTDEFEALLEETLDRAQRRKELDKREYYANALANSALPTRPNEETRWWMLDRLEQMRPLDLRLLAAAASGQGDGLLEQYSGSGGQLGLFARLLGIQTAEVDRTWAHLHQIGVMQPMGQVSTTRNLVTRSGMTLHMFISDPVVEEP